MKIGLFFGAGAEIGYGLPSGGKFAIDLFRQDPTPYKIKFREQLKNINSRSLYANSWLPRDYDKKNIFVFGKNEFTSIIESSIQYKRNEIIEKLNDFDSEFLYACKQLEIDIDDLKMKFSKEMGKDIGEVLYDQDIKLNEKLAKDVKLFGSEYYSSVLEIIRSRQDCDDLKRYTIAFLQLLVGAYGQDFVQSLNEELFESAPDDLPIFDDVFGMFRLEFDRVGSTALELLLNEKRSFDISDNSSIISSFSAISQKILENLFSIVLDYQKLIDDHFRFLFSPSTEWAKFTRMAIFMEIAHKYIMQQMPKSIPSEGYYHDVKSFIDSGREVSVIGTSNYNSLFQEINNQLNLPQISVFHLNGSTKDFYNPYKNEVIQIDDRDSYSGEQIIVPFMLTQSGLKPLTSVEMSRRYVDLFDAYKNSDIIISVGFGFNKDDSHINGLFRELVEKENKKLFVVTIDPKETAQVLKKKLRLDKNLDNVRVILVNPETRESDGTIWYEKVSEQLR